MSSIFNNIIYDEILPYQQKDVLKIMLFVFLGISLTSTIVSFVRQWILILFMTVISILLVFIFKQPYKKINEEQMQQASILNSEIIEGLRSVETIKGNANEDVTLEGIEKEYIKSLRISYKEGMLSNIQSTISSVISGLGNLVLLYTGISQVINADLTLGSYMAFTTLAGYFMEPVSNLVSLQLSIQEANISMRRLSEILDYEREIGMDEEEMMHVEGGWSFKYSGLKNICGIPVGAYFTLSGTVSDMAWIAAAGGAFVATIAGLLLTIPGIGGALALKAAVAGGAFVAFAATIVATNDRACKKRFSKKTYLGI